MPKYLHELIMDDVLTELANEPLTIRQLERRLQANYYTVRRAIRVLEDQDKVRAFDKQTRNIRYTLGANNGPKSYIPKVRVNQDTHKVHLFATGSSMGDDVGSIAREVQKTINNIVYLAHRLNEGTPTEIVEKALRRLKPQLIKNRNLLESVVFLINQILDEPKLWNTEQLEQFSQDTDWAEQLPLIIKTYKEFNDE